MFRLPFKLCSILFALVIASACSNTTNSHNAQVKEPTNAESEASNQYSVPLIEEFPLQQAIYGRNSKNLCHIPISGKFSKTTHTNAVVTITRDGLDYSEDHVTLDPSNPESSVFYFNLEIESGLYAYAVTLSVHNQSGESKSVAHASDLACGDIYLINGQSNALANERYNETDAQTLVSPWIRTFGKVSGSTTSRWFIADDINKKYDEPVGQWGMHLASTISKNQEVPVAIFNGAVGGSTILEHQRNDSSPIDPSTIYGRLLSRTQEAKVNRHIKAVLWHQGESDQGQEDSYVESFNELYYDWAEDYPNKDQIYLFQIRQGCKNYGRLKEVQRELPVLFTDITIMSTTSVPGYDGCHYYYQGYEEFSKRIYRLIDRDIYGAPNSPNIEAPNIIDARQLSKRRILLTFHDLESTLYFEPGAVDDFYLSDTTKVISAVTKGNQIYLTLEKPTNAGRISYVGRSPEGAWVTNENNVGILAFYRYRIR